MNVHTRKGLPAVRALPEDVANKIAAGEVVERPASVVKELVENALDAGATRVVVRLVAAGRRTVEVVDNGHGMSEQDALLAIERHTTSKIRTADDLDNIATLGFRGEALASIASVSRFELVTRRAKDDAATRIRIEGGILRSVEQTAAPPGTRVTVNRLYFNTPARAKFMKGIATELSHCIDVVQRHALAREGVGFQAYHNDKLLLETPENARLRERIALIWGLGFVNGLIEVDAEAAGLRVRGYIGTPALTRSQRSHQLFFFNGRPVVSRSLQYGFEEGYRELLTVGRHPVGILLVEAHPRYVDVNVHPAKREIRFRDERAARAAVREVVRARLEVLEAASAPRRPERPGPPREVEAAFPLIPGLDASPADAQHPAAAVTVPDIFARYREPVQTELGGAASIEPSAAQGSMERMEAAFGPGQDTPAGPGASHPDPARAAGTDAQEAARARAAALTPDALYRAIDVRAAEAPVQVFDTYLIVPEEDRLLIVDQHALHERLRYDELLEDLRDRDYEAQQLAVPLLLDVPPSHVRLLEANLELFSSVGIEIEPFGGNTFQVTAICHLYEESRVPDTVYRALDLLAQGELFEKRDALDSLLRVAVEACRGSVKAGDRLTPEERRGLLEGFRRLRPPYTCPHGRPIVTELTLSQMEKSFRRRQ